MRMKLKNLKKLISVAIICTMIAALFVPTLSVQAAETQAIQNVIENYTDIENSEYKILDVTHSYGEIYVRYSVPEACKLILAEYDGVTGYLRSTQIKSLSSGTNSSIYFYLDYYGNQSLTIKLFIVDSNNRPLGKSYTESYEITENNEAPSFFYGYDMDPHPTVPLKNDSGRYAYAAPWSVDTDGVLSLPGGNTYLSTDGRNTMPWNEYREGITSIVMSEDMCEVGGYMFEGMNKVKEVTIPAHAQLYEKAFIDMASLETVVLSYDNGNNNNGYYYPSLDVKGGSFINCPALKEFIVDKNDNNYMTIDGVLYSKDGTTLIRYPAGKTDKTFTIPDTVKYIDSYAFEGATNLESIYNVSYLDSPKIFSNCTSLKNIEISSSVEMVDLSAFENCTSLKQLVFPASVGSIYENHNWDEYDDRFKLETTALESINIPSNSTDYPEDFAAMLPGSLKNITVSADDSNFKLVGNALFSTDMTKLYRYLGGSQNTTYTVPDSVTSIEQNAFKNCKNLKSITVGSNVTTIGSNVFEGCTNLTDITLTNISDIASETFKNCINLKNVELGSAKQIYQNAFYGCKSLESITIPASVDYIENGIFAHCDSLKSISVAEGNTSYSTFDDCLYCGSELKEYPNAKAENYVVSSDTTNISNNAFEGRNSLKSVVIPDSVTEIGSCAFSECSNLTSVSLPQNLYDLNSYIFSKCTSLSSIDLPDSLHSIGSSSFEYCKSLKSIEFPELTDESSFSIGEKAFSHSGLESVTLPKKIYLNYNVFFGCFDLKWVKFQGDSYDNMTSFVFWNIDDLTIYYPEGNTTWNAVILHNYEHKDSFKFVSYNDTNNNYNCSYTFNGLEPNTTYMVGVSKELASDTLFDSDTLIYFDQLNSDSKGNITISYKISANSGKVIPFVLRPAKYDISNVSIEIGEVIYSGKSQDKPDHYTVTLDGEELIEGVDYLVTKDSGFFCEGTFDFEIVGIGDYYGTTSQLYKAKCYDYDVDGDDIVTIRDVTAIQFYLADLRGVKNLYAADANNDGEITVEDATHIQKLLAGIC